MSAPPYMKLFWGDYLKDTTHLTGREHGPYLLLIGAMWQAGGKLPNNDALLARHARSTPKEWAAVRDVVMAFFKVSGGFITHKRVKKEMAQYSSTVRKRKEAGKLGGSVRRGKDTDSSQANAKQTPSKSRHNQNHNQKGRKEPIEGSFSTRQARGARDLNGLAPPPSVINLEELRDRIAKEAAELAAGKALA